MLGRAYSAPVLKALYRRIDSMPIVNCEEHGEHEGCIICTHLISMKGLGFAQILIAPDEDDYETAMCGTCEAQLLEDQEWSDKLSELADWQIFCRECYERTLKKHTLIAQGNMS